MPWHCCRRFVRQCWLAQAAASADWPWQLQAERGRALLLGPRAAQGTTLLREALQQLIALKAPSWQVARYQAWLKRYGVG